MMMIKTKEKILILIVSLLFSFDVCASNTDHNELNVSTSLNLLQKYAPILCMHPNERFYPTNVKVMLENSKLCTEKWLGLGIKEVKKIPTLRLLMKKENNDEHYNLQLTGKAKDLLQDTNHWKTKITVYGRKVVDEYVGNTVLQYWFFYIYNDWQNKHEGDWEMIQINLDKNDKPKYIVYSIHHGGNRLEWDDKMVSKDDKKPEHPLIYVTLGGHGCWNEPGDHRWYQGKHVCFLDCVDETGNGDSLYPNIEPFTSKKDLIYELKDISNLKENDWIYWNGYWGKQEMGLGKSGPPSPPYIDYIEEKRNSIRRWEFPFLWAFDPNPLTYFICASTNSKIIVRDKEGNNMRLYKGCKVTMDCNSCPDYKIAYSYEDKLEFNAYSLDGKEVDLEITKYISGKEPFKEMYPEMSWDRNVLVRNELDLEISGYKRKEEVTKVVFNKLAIPIGGKATFLFSKELNHEFKINIDKNDDNIFESDISPSFYDSTIKGDELPNIIELEQMKKYEKFLEDDRLLDSIESGQMSE